MGGRSIYKEARGNKNKNWKYFLRKYHKLCGDFGEPLGDTNILVTKELYQEILHYVTESEDIQCEQLTDGLIFRLKDGVKI